MPADGSQYLTKQTISQTTRGDTSATAHAQTVTYSPDDLDPMTDTTIRNITGNKVTTQLQALSVPGAGDTSETTVKGPRAIQVQFTVDLLGTTIFC